MRATLTFKLPEEEAEHRMALRGPLYLAALEEICAMLRNRAKYGKIEKTGGAELDFVRARVASILEESGIDPYDA